MRGKVTISGDTWKPEGGALIRPGASLRLSMRMEGRSWYLRECEVLQLPKRVCAVSSPISSVSDRTIIRPREGTPHPTSCTAA